MTSPAPPRRRWVSYSLRTLLVAVTVLGVFLAWLGVQVKWVHDRHAALKSIPAEGWVTNQVMTFVDAEYYRPAPWSIRWLDWGFAAITLPREFPRHGPRVDELKRLFPEARIQIRVVDQLPDGSENPRTEQL